MPDTQRPIRHRLLLSIVGILATLAMAPAAPAAELVNETFSKDGTLADYAGEGKPFTAFSAEAPGSGTVADGQLTLSLTGGTESGNLHAFIALGGAKDLLSIKFDFNAVTYADATNAFQLYVGAFGEMKDFNPTWHSREFDRNWAKVTVEGTDPYTVSAWGSESTPGGTAAGQYGKNTTWSLFFNHSGSDQTYIGPDKAQHKLGNGGWTLFIDDKPVANDIAKGTGGASRRIMGIAFNISRNYPGGTSITRLDNLIVRDDLNLYAAP